MHIVELIETIIDKVSDFHVEDLLLLADGLLFGFDVKGRVGFGGDPDLHHRDVLAGKSKKKLKEGQKKGQNRHKMCSFGIKMT